MDWLATIKQREEEEGKLYERMDTDANLLYLKKYTLTDTKGRAVPDIVNVTLNKPAVFSANVFSALGGVKQQVEVMTENKGIDTSYIEEWQKAVFKAANWRLVRRQMPTLDMFADGQFCFRGRHGRRVLCREVDGEFIPDITPWDGKFLRYGMGENGLVWAAYKTKRQKELVEAEYPGVVCKGRDAEVIDLWTPEFNCVYVDSKAIFEQYNPYGEVPVVIETVTLGYGNILIGDNSIEHTGESIFFLIRDIVPQINMLVSILQTLNLKLVKPPQQFASKEGKDATPPEYEDATGMGSITSVDIGGGVVPVSYGDARNAAQMAYNMMEKAIQEGGYTDIDIGNVTQPFSAVALITIGETKDQIYMPRLAAKESLNVQTAQMFTRQALQIGGSLKVGVPGHQDSFNTTLIDGDYTTDYKYFVKSPKTDIARMSVANAASKWYPRKYVLGEVLQVEDVNEVEREWQIQEAELISPNVKKHRVIMALLEEAEKGDDNAAREAQIMAMELGVSLELLKKGIFTPQGQQPMTPPNVTGESMPPLLGKGGQTGGIPAGVVESGVENTLMPEG